MMQDNLRNGNKITPSKYPACLLDKILQKMKATHREINFKTTPHYYLVPTHIMPCFRFIFIKSTRHNINTNEFNYHLHLY